LRRAFVIGVLARLVLKSRLVGSAFDAHARGAAHVQYFKSIIARRKNGKMMKTPLGGNVLLFSESPVKVLKSRFAPFDRAPSNYEI
jgi:hypothetical protein